MYIINSRGGKESFSQKKLYHSAKRAGVSDKSARMIAINIAKEIYPGIRTSEIFRKIKGLLQKESPVIALKFNIKESMRKLGPTGFPFEQFVAEIFRAKSKPSAMGRQNYRPEVVNYFSLYFNKYA